MLNFILLKSSLTVQVWEDDKEYGHFEDDKIDNFTITLSSPLNKFNPSNSLTIQGHHRVGNLTLSYGNLTIDPTSCSSAVQPTFSNILYTLPGNLFSPVNLPADPHSCFSQKLYHFTALIQTHGTVLLYYSKDCFSNCKFLFYDFLTYSCMCYYYANRNNAYMFIFHQCSYFTMFIFHPNLLHNSCMYLQLNSCSRG